MIYRSAVRNVVTTHMRQVETYLISIEHSLKNTHRAFEWRCTYLGLSPAVFRHPTDFHRTISLCKRSWDSTMCVFFLASSYTII